MSIKNKVRTLRKMATKQGYGIMKKDDGYMVIDLHSNFIVRGNDYGLSYTWTLEDVEQFINDIP